MEKQEEQGNMGWREIIAVKLVTKQNKNGR